jgi:hypothetical protein
MKVQVSCRLPQRFVTRVRGSLRIVAQRPGSVMMEQWTPERGGPGISSRSGRRRRLVVGLIRNRSIVLMCRTYRRRLGG